MNEPEIIIPCPWPACPCTHTHGCVAGWLDAPRDADGYDGVRACRNCRPELAEHMSKRGASPRQLRDQVRTLPRPSKTTKAGAA